MDELDDGIREFVDEDSNELVTERRGRFLQGGSIETEWKEIERTPLKEVVAELPSQTKSDVKGDDGQE